MFLLWQNLFCSEKQFLTDSNPIFATTIISEFHKKHIHKIISILCTNIKFISRALELSNGLSFCRDERSRSRSPPRSKSTSPATTPPPSNEGLAGNTTPPLVRPIPTSFPGGISPQTYLDHLANLKALYDQHQARINQL